MAGCAVEGKNLDPEATSRLDLRLTTGWAGLPVPGARASPLPACSLSGTCWLLPLPAWKAPSWGHAEIPTGPGTCSPGPASCQNTPACPRPQDGLLSGDLESGDNQKPLCPACRQRNTAHREHLGLRGPGSPAGVSAPWRLRAWGALAGGTLFGALWLLWLMGWAPGGPLAPPPIITILVWHWPFAEQPPELPGDTCSQFGVARCRLSANQSLLASADAVVFHHRELETRRSRLPLAQRPPGQPWIWACMESPSHTHGLRHLQGIFNWVLSYRRDADIFVPYGRLEPHTGPTPPLPPKSRMAAWVVSNFQERQKRARLYRQLAPHLQVDVFGRASGRPLCASCLLPTVARYRFYLSFENSQHRDYITEKLWRNALAAGAVPVVLGPPRATYEAFVPPEAFVHVDDFGSARELAVFLSGMNESHYGRFFAWRDRLRVRLLGDWRERFCAICALYPRLPRGQVYDDLEGWFQG